MKFNNRYQKNSILLISALFAVMALASCQQEGPAETTGQNSEQGTVDAAETRAKLPDDMMITSKVKAALLRDEILKTLHIEVTTFNGEVTLIGAVESEELANRAISVANSQEYVKGVQNELMVGAAGSGN